MNNMQVNKKINQDDIKKLITKTSQYIAKTIYLFFIFLVFIIMLSLLNSKLKKQDPSFAGYKFYVVLSQSMEPTMDIGSLVIVKPVNPINLMKGDIITFTTSDLSSETITHRIIDIKKENTLNFLTKGDANKTNDASLVPESNVIGKVIFSISYIGRLFLFLRTTLGIITLIIIPSLCVGIAESIKLATYIHKKNKIE